MEYLLQTPVWPPLYTIQAPWRCARCDQSTPVVLLVAERYDENYEGDLQRSEEELYPIGGLVVLVLTKLVDLPPGSLAAIQRAAPGFRWGTRSDGGGCYMNHCGCGAVIEDEELLDPAGPFELASAEDVRAGRVTVSVLPAAGPAVLRCIARASEAAERVHATWWRSMLADLLERLHHSAKPHAREHAAALARFIACLREAEEDLGWLNQGVEPPLPESEPAAGRLAPEPVPGAPRANFFVHDPVYVVAAEHACWKCEANSPVAGLVAERHHDISDGDDAPMETYPVLLNTIEWMPPEVEHALRGAAPGIRRDHSKTAQMSYFMNHCRACGARFGDFFLTEVDGPFWAMSPEEFDRKRISFTVLPLRGTFGLRCGAIASDVLVWIHDHWCHRLLESLQRRLERREDDESRSFAVAIEHLLGELAYVFEEIDVARTRVSQAHASRGRK